MRCLGLDLGTKTLGTALSDKLGTIANPHKTIKFKNYDELIKPLKDLIDDYEVEVLVLGLPKNMDNSLGFASDRSLKFKEFLENHFTLPVELVDERLSTVEAEKYMLEADMSRKKRHEHIDAVAASVILSTYLRMKGNDKNE